MLVTKHAAELLALLVNDLYGELSSRILVTLLNKGRLSIAQVAQHTSLGPRLIRNGLGILIQQNLLYHTTNPDSRATSYEANPDACYNLVRSGKILEIIESQYGTAERDLVQTLMLLGHARIADLIQAFESRKPKVNGHKNGSHESSGLIQSENRLKVVLGRLIQAEIVETVRPESFKNPTDIYHDIDEEVTATAPGEKAKNKADLHRQVTDRYRAFCEQSRLLKRQLDQDQGPPSAKRRRTQNGHSQNGHSHDGDFTPEFNPNIVVRINHDKCLVELRNQRLANFAADTIGDVTGEVYRALLDLVTSKVSRCRPDPFIGESPFQQVSVTTMDIYDHQDDDVNVIGGVGKAPRDKLDLRSAERIKAVPPGQESDSDSDNEPPLRRPGMGAIESDDDDESDESDEPTTSRTQKQRSMSKTNGDRQPKVKFDDEVTSKESRLDRMRQHLLLLSESKHQFIRHCGSLGRGQWTVDFEQLLDRLRDSELDAFIEQSFGRHGLRLTRILREKGKLDEKLLHSSALMKKSDVQGKMLAMQMAGLVDVQEVPKDSSRMANRTLFFWFFDGERTQSQLLDDVYKAMLRCLQTLQVQRHRERNILSFVERMDVKGKEEEVMTAEHYNKYNRHLESQEKLLGQLMRLDDMVAVFRDY